MVVAAVAVPEPRQTRIVRIHVLAHGYLNGRLLVVVPHQQNRGRGTFPSTPIPLALLPRCFRLGTTHSNWRDWRLSDSHAALIGARDDNGVRDSLATFAADHIVLEMIPRLEKIAAIWMMVNEMFSSIENPFEVFYQMPYPSAHPTSTTCLWGILPYRGTY